jgi:16S rRNA C967 or C1407 C5-methylase (RsmB/RsmF family)
MKIYYSGRATGKTTHLINQCAKNNGVIICVDTKHCRMIEEQAVKMGVKINKPITIKNSSIILDKVYVDDAEFILRELLKEKGIQNLEMITINDESNMWLYE